MRIGQARKIISHYLELKLKGKGMNTGGIGAKIFLYANGKKQYQEEMPSRGFQSSVSPVIHFGLGNATQADSLSILWPLGAMQTLHHVKADEQLTLNEKDAIETLPKENHQAPIFNETKSPVSYRQPLSTTNDFKRQPLMVNPISFSGPCMVKGDVNGDGFRRYLHRGCRREGRFALPAAKESPVYSKTTGSF